MLKSVTFALTKLALDEFSDIYLYAYYHIDDSQSWFRESQLLSFAIRADGKHSLTYGSHIAISVIT
jgi:hypothetical protein